ncbi:transcriptional regulator, partial [Streptomyces sp. NPDC004561]
MPAMGASTTGGATACGPMESEWVIRRLMERADPAAGDDPVWIAHFDGAYLADELAHCHRDLGQAEAAARCAEQSLAGHPESRARRRAIGYVLLATAQVQQREIEQACATGLKAVELLETLRSNRGAEYLEDLQQRLEPFRDESVVREFGARLDLQQAA